MKPNSMEAWDKNISPYLSAIQMRAIFLKIDAKAILDHCEKIAACPSWETEAQDELNKGIEAIEHCLGLLKRAQQTYNEKPKIT